MFSNYNLEWTSICDAIINNKDSIEKLIAEVNSLIKFKEEAEAEAERRKDEYNLLSNCLDTLESYLSKNKNLWLPEEAYRSKCSLPGDSELARTVNLWTL